MKDNFQNTEAEQSNIKFIKSDLKTNKSSKYKIIKIIGQGSFGKVSLATDCQNNKVAIKNIIHNEKYKNREIELLQQLDHPNIVKIKDSYISSQYNKKQINIVMEYIPTTLFLIIKQRLKEKQLLQNYHDLIKIYSFQLLKALAYLQDKNISHRDLKPSNILVNHSNYQLKICDFGSAKTMKAGQQNLSYICSRYYRAPQLILGYTHYSVEIDMWSFGCILVELLTCEPLFPGDSSLQQMIQIIKILGTPTLQYLERYSNLDQNLMLPKINRYPWKKLLKNYNPKIQFLDLIEKCLVYDIEKRIKPIDALLHQYFDDLNSIKYKKIIQNLHLFDFEKNEFKNDPIKGKLLKQKFLYRPNKKNRTIIKSSQNKENQV